MKKTNKNKKLIGPNTLNITCCFRICVKRLPLHLRESAKTINHKVLLKKKKKLLSNTSRFSVEFGLHSTVIQITVQLLNQEIFVSCGSFNSQWFIQTSCVVASHCLFGGMLREIPWRRYELRPSVCWTFFMHRKLLLCSLLCQCQ